jgi:hypothetical protein
LFLENVLRIRAFTCPDGTHSAYIDYKWEIIRGTGVDELMEQDMHRKHVISKKRLSEKQKENENKRK